MLIKLFFSFIEIQSQLLGTIFILTSPVSFLKCFKAIIITTLNDHVETKKMKVEYLLAIPRGQSNIKSP